MKKLNDLKKQLPSSEKLNPFEFTRIKGGSNFGNGTGNGGGKRPSEGDDDSGFGFGTGN